MKIPESFKHIYNRIYSKRYGNDDFNLFLLTQGVILLLLSILLRFISETAASFLFLSSLTLSIWAIWRSFSTDFSERNVENRHFKDSRFYTSYRGALSRFSQRKEYHFYRCPGCREWLRVPIGLGTVEIKCQKCNSKFKKST